MTRAHAPATTASDAQRRATRVFLGDESLVAVIGGLQPLLADLVDLRSQAKEAHWTVKGPQFAAHHALFDKLARRLDRAIDKVAERISTLGGQPQATVRDTAIGSRLPELPTALESGTGLVRQLTSRYAQVAEMFRKAIDRFAPDPVTENLVIDLLGRLELDLWTLDSHLQSAA